MLKKLLKSCLMVLIVGSALWMATPQTHAAIFTVDSLADTADFFAGDGVCDTDDGVGDGPCTLRAAIEEANTTVLIDSINLDLDGTIVLGSALPMITEAVSISGTGAPSFSGNGAANGGANPAGFTYTLGIGITGVDSFTDIFHFTSGAAFSSISGIAFNTYDQAIVIDGADGLFITLNYFGMTPGGVATGTQTTAIIVETSADGTNIGDDEGGNVMINHDGDAIIVTSSSTNTIIEENNIGVGPDSTTLLAVGDQNAGDGIFLTGSSDGTTINFNRICSNGGNGILVSSALNSTITANIIGADIDDEDFGNTIDGIDMILSGATTDLIGTNGDGTDDASEGNTIVGNGSHGIDVDAGGTGDVTIAGNFIGETRGGTDLGNDFQGIEASEDDGRIGSDNDGTSDTEEGNIISNNGSVGVLLLSDADSWIIRDNTIDDNATRGIQNGTFGVPTGPFGTIIDRNTVSNHGPGGGTNGIGIENGTFSSFTRNSMLGNRVGFSIDLFNGATAFVGGATSADGNDFSGSTLDGMHVHDTNSSVVLVHNNTFGDSASNLNNLSIRSNFVNVGGTGFGNTFHEPSAGGKHITIFDEGAGTDPEGNTIDNENTFMQPTVAPFFIAIDLFDDGPSGTLGIFPSAGDPNRAIDPPASVAQTAGTLTVTGTAEASSTIRVYTSPTTDQGIAENFLTTTTTSAGGDWSIDLTGFATFGDIVAFNQTDIALGDSSEFVALELSGSPPSTGTRRRTNVLRTQDYTAPLGLPSELIQGVDLDGSSTISSLSFTSTDEDPITIFRVDPEQQRNGIFFTSFLESVGQFLTAMIFGEGTAVAAVFEGQGSEDYFVPLEAGEYHFQVNANHPSGNTTSGNFVVTVEAPLQSAIDCSPYQGINQYWQTVENVQTCNDDLQGIVTSIKDEAISNIPAECLEVRTIPPPQLSCIETDQCINPDFAQLKQLYIDTLKPLNFNQLFPEENEANQDVRSLVGNFESELNDHFDNPHNVDQIEETQCQYKYGYYDYPGQYRFEAFGMPDNVLMVYQIENIFSGLITGKILGSYINLIRAHAIIATSRLYNDQNGVFWALFEEKDLGVEHVDVDPEAHPLRQIYGKYEQGYSLEEAIILALEEEQFVSIYDMQELLQHVQGLEAKNQATDDVSRFLFPTSDIRRVDLIDLIESSIHLTRIFESDGSRLDLPEVVDSSYYRNLIGPYFELGIITQLDRLNEPIPRGEAFTLFYRLQQLNIFLRDELDLLGIDLRSDGTFSIEDKILSQEEALNILQSIITDVLDGNSNINLILKTRTITLVSDFWNSWNAFLERDEFPFKDIREVLIESKNPDLAGIAEVLDQVFLK